MADPNHLFWQCVRGDVPPPPAVQLLGWKVLEADVGGGRISLEFEAKREFANPLGNVHGGFISAMLDNTLADALATTLEKGEFGPTVELKVNYIRPANLGTILAEGRIVHRGKSVVFLDGELIATATANTTRRRIRRRVVPRPPARTGRMS